MIRMIILRGLVFLAGLASVACPAEATQLPEAVTGICITDLEGDTVLLDGRIVREGDVLTAQQAGRLSFARMEGDPAVTVGYLPIYEDRVEPEAELTLSLRRRENQPPVAEDQALETYKNLPNTAALKVHDPEGEALTYTLVRQPRRGTLEIGEDGSFTYTPKKNKVGIDSFTYTATDAAGKTSREATVTVTILKPTDATQYTDTLGQECRFAAEWMRHTGIFVAEQVGEEACFGPDKAVTQGEFLTMLVKTLDIPREEQVDCPGYEEAPSWLKPYLAAAIRSGLTAGLETIIPEKTITGEEAGVLLKNALDVSAFAELTQEPLTRADAAQILYEAAKHTEAQKIDRIV